MAYSSLGSMFKEVCEKFPEKTGMMYKKEGVYHSIPFKDIQQRVYQFAAGMASLGVKKGDRVLLLSENRIEWAFTDYANQVLGAWTVPVYPTLLPKSIEYIANNCEGKILVVSDPFQLKKIEEIRNELKFVKHIVVMDGEAPENGFTWEGLREKGKDYLEKNPQLIEESIKNLTREDLATIIYTSGTTGLPKGVMLTHGNFLSNIEGCLEVISVDHTDTFLSFLPLSHVFERMAGHYLAFSIGATIAYAENIETVAENLNEVHPTIMTSVPRFFEKVYAKIMDSLEEGPALKKKLFLWAIEVGKKVNLYKQSQRPIPGLLKMKHRLADKLVFSKLKDRVGGRMRIFISGGAPLSREIGEFFNAAGLLLLEGYGLTETSPVIAVNRADKMRFGSVGPIIPNVEVKIAEDGEILTRGPHVMKGYFKDEAATADVLEPDGWLHTGDIGYLDKDGFLFITDRKKNIIVTSGGKNIAPQPIENLLVMSPYIEQALVLGDKRKYCVAFIVPALDKLKAFADQKGLKYENDDQLLELPEIQQIIREEIDKQSVDLASYETIKKFKLFKEPFSIESGDLTPSLKIKRNVVEAKYKDILDAMYAEDPLG
ncbi:MAG: AMP-dependent synthetase/ligase [Calditrichia bacterium]